MRWVSWGPGWPSTHYETEKGLELLILLSPTPGSGSSGQYTHPSREGRASIKLFVTLICDEGRPDSGLRSGAFFPVDHVGSQAYISISRGEHYRSHLHEGCGWLADPFPDVEKVVPSPSMSLVWNEL